MLAGLLLPALNQARATAKLAGCTNNLRQIGGANAMYVNDYEGYVAYTSPAATGTWGWWFYFLPPYLGKKGTIPGYSYKGYVMPGLELGSIWTCPENPYGEGNKIHPSWGTT
ncbi:MAG: DUF1559 domain-containing protein [Ignavibacteria bacterium]|nr:MAG: DUF1559 domain-containing protein [Ignavibacteria bacterium]